MVKLLFVCFYKCCFISLNYLGPNNNLLGFIVVLGRDGSRAFVTGDFTESGLIDDVLDLTLSELRSLNDWLQFYQKEYIYKGMLYNLHCLVYNSVINLFDIFH